MKRSDFTSSTWVTTNQGSWLEFPHVSITSYRPHRTFVEIWTWNTRTKVSFSTFCFISTVDSLTELRCVNLRLTNRVQGKINSRLNWDSQVSHLFRFLTEQLWDTGDKLRTSNTYWETWGQTGHIPVVYLQLNVTRAVNSFTKWLISSTTRLRFGFIRHDADSSFRFNINQLPQYL